MYLLLYMGRHGPFSFHAIFTLSHPSSCLHVAVDDEAAKKAK